MSFKVDYFTLDATSASNMAVELTETITDATSIALDVVGGTAQAIKGDPRKKVKVEAEKDDSEDPEYDDSIDEDQVKNLLDKHRYGDLITRNKWSKIKA